MAAPSDDLELALELADIADTITVDRYLAADLRVQTKADLTPVSEADTAVERAVTERLSAARPADSVLGEEYGASVAPHAERRWIVDPIDGTMNYVRGVPVWATLVALQDGPEVTVGVASAPAMGRRWWATRGGGAFVDDGLGSGPRRLRVSSLEELRDAQLSFGEIRLWQELGRVDALLSLSGACWRTRSFGDFWAHMLVAEGSFEVALDPVVSLWDLAAPQVIVEEAGGRFSDLGGVRTLDGGDAIATNGLVHTAALAMVGR
jgi:histidinol-phosphatase